MHDKPFVYTHEQSQLISFAVTFNKWFHKIITPCNYAQGPTAFLKSLYISSKSHTVTASNAVGKILHTDILVMRYRGPMGRESLSRSPAPKRMYTSKPFLSLE